MAFKSGTPQPMKGTREYYERNYNVCRMNFLAVIAFTVISIITLMINDTYFLFSNYFAVEMAYVGLMYVTGNWQSWEDAGDYAEIGQEMLSVIGAGYIAVAAAVLIVLALCWVLSKKSRIPVIVAAVIMGFDTLYVLISFDIFSHITSRLCFAPLGYPIPRPRAELLVFPLPPPFDAFHCVPLPWRH